MVRGEMYLRCACPRLPPQSDGDAWFAQVVRGFETDESGKAWCGAAGAWHEPNDKDQAA